MKFLEWNNEAFGEYNVFLICNSEEKKLIQDAFPNEDVESDSFGKDDYYYFIDTNAKIITPMHQISYAFGGMYNGYPPYGDEFDNFSFYVSVYEFKKYTKFDRNRINED